MMLKPFVPGHSNRMIEKAHERIIELRHEKTSLLRPQILSYSTETDWGKRLKKEQIETIDEEIKGWEEVVKLHSGKLDPSRHKMFWGIIVPILISFISSFLFFHFWGSK